jgi:hypothetical protein
MNGKKPQLLPFLLTASLLILLSGCGLEQVSDPAAAPAFTSTPVPTSTPAPIPQATRMQPSTETQTPSPVAASATNTPGPSPSAPASGDEVYSLQDPPLSGERIGGIKFRLMELGYFYDPEVCAISAAFYTRATEAAIRSFQAVNALEANGVADAGTLERLFSANAMPAPGLEAPYISASRAFDAPPGSAFVIIDGQIWILDEYGMITAFSLDGEFNGLYQVEPLPGEEEYRPAALWFNGDYLWIAQQGPGDAVLQAYDPDAASPAEASLKPIFDRSIHFPSQHLHAAASSDGDSLWLLVEDLDKEALLLQPVNLSTQAAGTPIRLEMSSGYSRGDGIAYDTRSGNLWVLYGDDIFGEGVVVQVNPASPEAGEALPVCSRQMAFDGDLLWLANENRLLAINPMDGNVQAQSLLDADARVLYANGKIIWVMAGDGGLYTIGSP